MKQLGSFMVMNIDGGLRVSYTYDEIDDVTGELISQNNKKSFFAMDKTLIEDINKVQNFIKENKLQ